MISYQNVFKELEEQAKCWRGEESTFLQTPKEVEKGGSLLLPLKRDRVVWWGLYNTEERPRPGLMEFVQKMNPQPEKGGLAIDLGCGHSFSSASLLEREWKVIFLDYSKEALKIQEESLKTQIPLAITKKLVDFVCCRAEEYVFPKGLNVVIGNNSLNFFNPQQIPSLFERIYDALDVGGLFMGNFWHYEEYKMKAFEEMGSWVVKDEKSAQVLLESIGFEVTFCNFLETRCKSLTFCATKGEDKLTKPWTQLKRFNEFHPKNNEMEYWFYLAKNSFSKGDVYSEKAIGQLENREKILTEQSYKRKTVHGWSVLHVAVLATNKAAISYFLSKGVDPENRDKEGLNVLDYVNRYNREMKPLFSVSRK